jgi:hypothetical protein
MPTFRFPPRAGAAIVLLLSIIAVAPAALAFGSDGHRIVGELAQRKLSGDARAEIALLLASETESTLAGIANWADDVRETPAYAWSARLHYVNFPHTSCDYDPRRDCRDGQCIVGAIERYTALLADRDQPLPARREALKFLVHFVADIHQPLHAGHADDRGGNLFQVYYLGHGSNLHALWDGGILRSARREWREYADMLSTRSSGHSTHWSMRMPQRWAQESCRLIEEMDLYPSRPGRVPTGYVERQLPVIEARLVQAGVRLATLLNATLANP